MRQVAADEGQDATVPVVPDLVSAHTLTTGVPFTGDLPRLAVVLEDLGWTTTSGDEAEEGW